MTGRHEVRPSNGSRIKAPGHCICLLASGCYCFCSWMLCDDPPPLPNHTAPPHAEDGPQKGRAVPDAITHAEASSIHPRPQAIESACWHVGKTAHAVGTSLTPLHLAFTTHAPAVRVRASNPRAGPKSTAHAEVMASTWRVWAIASGSYHANNCVQALTSTPPTHIHSRGPPRPHASNAKFAPCHWTPPHRHRRLNG